MVSVNFLPSLQVALRTLTILGTMVLLLSPTLNMSDPPSKVPSNLALARGMTTAFVGKRVAVGITGIGVGSASVAVGGIGVGVSVGGSGVGVSVGGTGVGGRGVKVAVKVGVTVGPPPG